VSGYSILSLGDILAEKGEDFCREILSCFSCPLNPDVEKFLTKRAAIDFEKQSISRTFLVYASYKHKKVICGYFTIANKFILVPKSAVPKTLGHRLRKFAIPQSPGGGFVISAQLVAQLGKNNDYRHLISGDELLKMAIDKIVEAQRIIGGKIVYVECEDKPQLTQFYERNLFIRFGARQLDKDEQDEMAGAELLQYLKYI